VPQFFTQLGRESVAGLRIGRLTAWMDAADPQVRDQIDQALQFMVQQGAVLVDVDIPEMTRLLSQSGLIAQEFEADLDAYLRQFGSDEYPNLAAIVAGGEYHEAVAGLLRRSADAEQNQQAYQAALAVRAELQQAIDALMATQSLDLIAYPPIASTPALIGEPQFGKCDQMLDFRTLSAHRLRCQQRLLVFAACQKRLH
jgi:Asp-tRNA(Asn)/Glu-tRNA(Gln) amidotransferase A subunit family amidase